jgi:hypothetical protein
VIEALAAGRVVILEIEIEGIGRLDNPVGA